MEQEIVVTTRWFAKKLVKALKTIYLKKRTSDPLSSPNEFEYLKSVLRD